MPLPLQLGLLKDQLSRQQRLEDDELQLLRELEVLDDIFSPRPSASEAMQMTGGAGQTCRCCGQTLRR